MNGQTSESDWKIFKKLHALALQRYFARTLREVADEVGSSGETKERFWNIHELMHKRGKEVSQVFDDFRRSTAHIQMARMVALDLVTKEEWGQFSPERQDVIRLFTER